MNPPYFINPVIDALPSATGEERTRLIRLLAANIGDESVLRAIVGIDPAEFMSFYPDMKPPELTTEATIDGFLSRFSNESPAREQEVERLIAAPAIDYAMLMEETEEDKAPDGPADATADVISSFLAAVPPKTPARGRRGAAAAGGNRPETRVPEAQADAAAPSPEPRAEASGPNTELSEALFRLMVKNKNYRKALEIIKELSLNNPKKSIYFAYQIRFLEKLIKNQERAGS